MNKNLVKSAYFGQFSVKKAKDVRDTSQRMSNGKHGKVVYVKVFSRDNGHELKAGDYANSSVCSTDAQNCSG